MNRVRVFAVGSIIAVLISGVVAPAHGASIRNGTTCKGSGAVTKVAGESYKCAKNPYLSPSKLTWTWVGCITTQASYIQYKKKLDLAKSAPTTDENLAQVSNLTDSVSYLENMAKESCAKGR